MKKIILIFITSLFIGCAPTGVQVTFDDEKSNTIRAFTTLFRWRY